MNIIFNLYSSNPPLFLRAILCIAFWIIHVTPTIAQEYAITKLQLFPDRDEVLIKDITVDSLGFIWFLTNGEIYRYDGYRSLDILKTIADQRATDDMPQRILIDRQNRLWMAGNADLSYLDLKTWKVHPVDSTLLPPVQQRTVSWMKQLGDSTVMVAYENGHLLSLSGASCTQIDDLFKLGASTNNRISPRSATFWRNKFWIGTSAGGILSIDSDNIAKRQYTQLSGLQRMVNHLLSQKDNLILDVYEQGIFRLGMERVPLPYRLGELELSSDKKYVLAEADGMYVYADEESVYLLDADLTPTQQLLIPSNNRFNTTATKIFGNEVLLGTDEGIFVVYPKTVGLSHLTPPNPGSNKSTRGLYVYSDGAIFYGTYNGAGFVDPKRRDTLLFPELKHAYVLLPINNNQLLVGTEGGGLKVFNRKSRMISDFEYELSETAEDQHAYNLPTYVMSLVENDSEFLIGSMSGLWLLDKRTLKLRKYELTTEEPHALDLHIRHIHQTDDSLLVLSTNIGLLELGDGKLTKRYPRSGNIGVFKSIANGDTTWIATQGNGLMAIDTEGNILRSITTNDGLSNNLVYSLEQVDDVLVVGTANGLDLIKGSQIRRIGMAEGLHQSEFNSGASFWDAARGRVYIGGLSGYTVLDMSQMWFDTDEPLNSYVTEIHVSTGGASKKSAEYSWPYRGERTLILQPDQSLTGLYLGTPGNYRTDSKIRYSLHNEQWEDLERGQFISLISPSPGAFQLNLETVSRTPTGWQKTVFITKLPTYYETWWFKTLVIVCIITLMWFWNRARLRKIKREQRLRNRIAADLHDEVGSSLTRIYYQAGTLSDASTIPRHDQQLKQIASTSRQALLSMSDMVWSIDARFDTMKDLVIRMKDYAYKLREELHVSCRFHVHGDYESKQIGQLVRQNLFLIYKEALSNAIQYGDGTEIEVALTLENLIQLEIRNRCAAKQDEHPISVKQGGRGLESIQQRVDKINGELEIQHQNGVFKLTVSIH